MVYDLAYINLPAIRIHSQREFMKKMDNLKEGMSVKNEGGLLCPNKVITTV